MSLLLRLTPSRTEDYQGCPLRFKLLHLDRLGPRERRPLPHLSFGASLHEALYRFYDRGGYEAVPPSALPRLLAQSWRADGYVDARDEAAYRAAAVRILERYYAAFRDEPVCHLGHELFLQARVRVGGTCLLLSGKIDRLSVWPDGHLQVVDYKTGTGPVPSPEKLAADLPTFLYYVLARLNYPEYSRVDVAHVYLQPTATVTAAYDAEAVAERKAALTRLVAEIAAGDFPPKPSHHCAWCEVRPLCPALRHTETDLDSLF